MPYALGLNKPHRLSCYQTLSSIRRLFEWPMQTQKYHHNTAEPLLLAAVLAVPLVSSSSIPANVDNLIRHYPLLELDERTWSYRPDTNLLQEPPILRGNLLDHQLVPQQVAEVSGLMSLPVFLVVLLIGSLALAQQKHLRRNRAVRPPQKLAQCTLTLNLWVDTLCSV